VAKLADPLYYANNVLQSLIKPGGVPGWITGLWTNCAGTGNFYLKGAGIDIDKPMTWEQSCYN
jgi:hypothetical protein